MKKLIKKVVSLFIIMSLVIALPTTVFASSETVDEKRQPITIDTGLQSVQVELLRQTSSVTISEYDMICELQQYSNEELVNMGFTSEDISKIRGLTVARGATETYGEVTYTIDYTEMYKSGGQTYITTKVTWNWSSEPSVLSTDIVAMTTSENFTKDSASVRIDYYLYGNKNSTKTSEYGTVKTEDAGTGVFARITMGKDWDTINKKYKKVALSGQMTTEWSVSGSYTQVGIAAKYGHSVITLNPSVSFGAGTSISFSPSLTCKSGDEAYKKATLK